MIDNAPLIRLVGAKKRYFSRCVIDIDDFTIVDRDRILLLGENGSGKSTLFRLLAGIARLSEGELQRSPQGRDLRVGFLPQAGGIYDDMSLRQNLALYCELYGAPVVQDPSANWFTQNTVLASLADVPVGTLSGGTRRLATLACIFNVGADALLLDEPMSELDPEHEAHVYRALQYLSERLVFLIVSSHKDDAGPLFNRKILMQQGRMT